MFQSKNPERFRLWYGLFPEKTILGTTIESNREYPEIYRNAPSIFRRYNDIFVIRDDIKDIMVTIEPILDFDLKDFVNMIQNIQPSWVNIGADSKGHNLPEPKPEKIRDLIAELKTFTQVRIKKNLKRILNQSKSIE